MNKRRGFLLAAVVLVVLLLLALKAISTGKPPTKSPTAKQRVQNECAMRVYQAHLKDKLALLPQPEDVAKLKFLSIENTIAKRRLEERFCLEFVQCVVDDPASTGGNAQGVGEGRLRARRI
jgi:hypothetical protein